MSENEALSVIYEEIVKNLENSYWENDPDEELINWGFMKVKNTWYEFNWMVGWGIILSSIKQIKPLSNEELAVKFRMKDSKQYHDYLKRKKGVER